MQALPLIGEDYRAQLRAIQRAVGVEDVFAKSLADRCQALRPWRNNIPRRLVCVQDFAAKISEHTEHERLSNCNRSRQANFQHASRWERRHPACISDCAKLHSKSVFADTQASCLRPRLHLRYKSRPHFAACKVFRISIATVTNP